MCGLRMNIYGQDVPSFSHCCVGFARWRRLSARLTASCLRAFHRNSPTSAKRSLFFPPFSSTAPKLARRCCRYCWPDGYLTHRRMGWRRVDSEPNRTRSCVASALRCCWAAQALVDDAFRSNKQLHLQPRAAQARHRQPRRQLLRSGDLHLATSAARCWWLTSLCLLPPSWLSSL